MGEKIDPCAEIEEARRVRDACARGRVAGKACGSVAGAALGGIIVLVVVWALPYQVQEAPPRRDNGPTQIDGLLSPPPIRVTASGGDTLPFRVDQTGAVYVRLSDEPDAMPVRVARPGERAQAVRIVTKDPRTGDLVEVREIELVRSKPTPTDILHYIPIRWSSEADAVAVSLRPDAARAVGGCLAAIDDGRHGRPDVPIDALTVDCGDTYLQAAVTDHPRALPIRLARAGETSIRVSLRDPPRGSVPCWTDASSLRREIAESEAFSARLASEAGR